MGIVIRIILAKIRKGGFVCLGITLSGVFVLSGLGTWQLYRLSWKQALIARIEARFQEAPFSVETLFQQRSFHKPLSASRLILDDLESLEFRPVTAQGTFLKGYDLKMYGQAKGPPGQMGYHLLTPLRLIQGPLVWVDRGWMPFVKGIPFKRRGPSDKREGSSDQGEATSDKRRGPSDKRSGPSDKKGGSSDQGEATSASLNRSENQRVTVTGYLRLRTDQNFMTPPSFYETGTIYSFEPLKTLPFFKKNPSDLVDGMSPFYMAPFYIVQTGPDPLNFLTQDAPLIPSKQEMPLRNFHLQYALTWYVLALILGSVYVMYVLDFSRKKR